MTLLLARTTRDVVVVRGPDAAGYLQGQLSQDVAGLEVGAVSQTFVLSPQGKVDGWGRLRRVGEEELRIDVDPGAGAEWEVRLNRFLLRTKADIEVVADVPMLAARGASGEPAVAALIARGWLPALWPAVDGADLLGEAAEDPEVVVAAVADGAVEVDAGTLDSLRIRAGVPRWGAEITHDTIPATLGQGVIDASVSFRKGCYTGQELVARIDSRGGNVPRVLHGVEITGGAPGPGVVVTVGDTEIGPLTSTAPDDEVGAVGLVFVPRGIEVPPDGRRGEVDGVGARLVHLPNPNR